MEVWGLRWLFRHPPQCTLSGTWVLLSPSSCLLFPVWVTREGTWQPLSSLPFWIVLQQKHLWLDLTPAGSDTICFITRTVLKLPDSAEAKSSKDKKCESVLKFLLLDMNSLKGTSHPSSMSSFLLVFIIYIPNHTAVFQALCWALMDIIPNPQKTFTLGMFLPILQKWQQLSDYSRTHHKQSLVLNTGLSYSVSPCYF